MKKMFFSAVLLCAAIFNYGQTSDLLITGIFDGPLDGGTPKGVELYVINDISDLSVYGIGSATNGEGSDGEEFTFPPDAVVAGDFVYIVYEQPMFNAFFGFDPGYTSGSMRVNGDDAVELFKNGVVVDVFGDINTDGNGEVWEYTDGWAYRKNDVASNDGIFTPDDWNYSGINALDNETVNSGAEIPFPAMTYSFNSGIVSPKLTITGPSDNEIYYMYPGEDPEVVIDFLVEGFSLVSDGKLFIKDFDGVSAAYEVNPQSSPVMLSEYLIFGSGEHSVTIELRDNDGNPLDPVVESILNFSVKEVVDVNDVASLRDKTTDDGIVYRLIGETLTVYQRIENGKQLWIRDNGAAILFFMPDNSDGLNEVGNSYKNIVGTLELNNGLLEFVLNEDHSPELVSEGIEVTVHDASFEEILSGVFESDLVKVSNVIINDVAGGDGTFIADQNYILNYAPVSKKGTNDELILRTIFHEAVYIGSDMPDSPVDIISIVGNNNGEVFIVPLIENEILENVLYEMNVTDASASVYPLPVNDKLNFESGINEVGKFEVYSISGQLLMSEKGNLLHKVLDFSALVDGVYVLKVSTIDKIYSYKLMK